MLTLNYSYQGRHAELYDLFYQDKPYSKEAQFLHHIFERYSSIPIKNIMELACGTASHALEMTKYPYQILALDSSEDMLRVAKKKIAHSDQIQLACGDMSTFDLPPSSLQAAYCLFDSIGYLQSNHKICQALQNIWQALEPHALFILEFWHTPAMLQNYEPLRIRHWTLADCKILRLSQTELMPTQSLAKVSYTIYELMQDDRYSCIKEEHINRYFSIPEMEFLLMQNNFEVLQHCNGFSVASPNASTWHVVTISKKKE